MKKHRFTIICVAVTLLVFACGSVVFSSRGFMVDESQYVEALEEFGFENIELIDEDRFFVTECGLFHQAVHFVFRVKKHDKWSCIDLCVEWPLDNGVVMKR